MLFFIAFVLSACSGPTAPSVLQVAGTWRGTLDGAPVALHLEQSDDVITGTWTHGTLAGTASGTRVQGTLGYHETPRCPLVIDGPTDGRVWSATVAPIPTCPGTPQAVRLTRD